MERNISQGILSDAHNFVISGGSFPQIQGDAHFNHSTKPEQGLKLLHENIAHGAFHNSRERYDPPKCHPGTRRAISRKILDWVHETNNSEPFLWLSGPAGAGKSAIAQSIAETCEETRLLAASFFFSRTASGRNSDTYFITTLAYQLILTTPEISDDVITAIERDPMILSRSLSAQARALIVNPLNDVAVHAPRPHLVIIDGLDECSEISSQQNILMTLYDINAHLHRPLYFLIASRPELQIRDTLTDENWSPQTAWIQLRDNYEALQDIQTFLQFKFDEIKRKHPSRMHLPRSWPNSYDISRLVENSSSQFIYASTVMKYISSPHHRPVDRLDVILGIAPAQKDIPFASLDAVYTHILASVQDISRVLEVLSFIILVEHRKMTCGHLELILGYHPGDVHIILNDIHALVYVPPPENPSGKVYLYHASLGDFLQDQSRSGSFFIHSGQAHATLARKYIHRCLSGPITYIPQFLYHFKHADLTPELMDDLDQINIVSRILQTGIGGIEMEYLEQFLTRLDDVGRDLDQENQLLRLHLAAFDAWMVHEIRKYPSQIRDHLPTLLTFADLMLVRGDILHLLLDGLDAAELEEVNLRDFASLHVLQRLPLAALTSYPIHIHQLFADPGRGGTHGILVGERQYASLAYLIAQSNFEREELNDDGVWELLVLLLTKAAEHQDLASLLWRYALQFNSIDMNAWARYSIGSASLDYIQRCNPKTGAHVHNQLLDICFICDLEGAKIQFEIESDEAMEFS